MEHRPCALNPQPRLIGPKLYEANWQQLQAMGRLFRVKG